MFERLLRDSYTQAYGLAYRMTGNAAEAEDLVQDAFVRAFRFFHRYDATQPFTSWLYRIMTNVHIDTLRRNNRIRTTSLDGPNEAGVAWQFADTAPTVERAMLDESLDEPVTEGLRSMTAEFRVAVLLADVEGLSYEEVAEIMNTSIGTVRSRIHRGRRQLRTYLAKRCPERYRAEVEALEAFA